MVLSVCLLCVEALCEPCIEHVSTLAWTLLTWICRCRTVDLVSSSLCRHGLRCHMFLDREMSLGSGSSSAFVQVQPVRLRFPISNDRTVHDAYARCVCDFMVDVRTIMM